VLNEWVPVVANTPISVSSPVSGFTQQARAAPPAVMRSMRSDTVVGWLRKAMTLSPSVERAAAFSTSSPPANRALQPRLALPVVLFALEILVLFASLGNEVAPAARLALLHPVHLRVRFGQQVAVVLAKLAHADAELHR
jgi:hypothetical protein